MNQEPLIDLTCYVYPTWRPRIRAASPRRGWMDATPESFAYRCLPLDIANAHGWEVLSPCGFEAQWNGGSAVEDVTIRVDPAYPADGFAPVALFGQGVLTFHVAGLFRTPPGYSLWVGGSPNNGKDGIAALGGVIETDWAPYSFTMNWRFTRPGHPVRFEENEPFCFLFPVERGLVERVRPRIVPIDDAPDLKRQYEAWSRSRDSFRAEVAAHPPQVAADGWQKAYYRGVDSDGAPGAPDHRAKLRLAEFEGVAGFHRETRAPSTKAAQERCPVHHAVDAPAARGGGALTDEGVSAAKLAWVMTAMERLRAVAPNAAIPRKTSLGAEEFRDLHYAANWPVLIEGAIADWPARRLWSPDYLKAKVGSAPVQVQTGRNADADFEQRMDAHAAMLPFDAFIDQISAPGAGNDTYLTAYNAAANTQALAALDDDLGFLDAYLARNGGHVRGMLWIGPQGTFTPLHHDITNNLLLQVTGRKCLYMAAPGETPKLYNDHQVYSRVRDLTEPDALTRFPRLNGIRVHRVILNPGDALFIPLGWWHQASSLDFSVSITHTNFHWPNDFHASYPAQA